MVRSLAWVLCGVIWAAACAKTDRLAESTRGYQQTGDYASLEVLVAQLRKGMPRREVEALLGPPDMEPTEGSCVYSSDRKVYVEKAEREQIVALLVEYRDETDADTQQLQAWEFRPIGE
jgi:outer membrane protein assembly factor BamE (lipoprotein component of BamABCDE complex)